MRIAALLLVTGAGAALGWPQTPELTTKEVVLEKYQQALGGAEAIRKVQSETRHGEVEAPGMKGKITFVSYAKPFKWLAKVTMPGGVERNNGFDGEVSWSIGPNGAAIDKSVPLESVRRDSDLQYALHEPDYFSKYEFAGITAETPRKARRCSPRRHGATVESQTQNQNQSARGQSGPRAGGLLRTAAKRRQWSAATILVGRLDRGKAGPRAD